MPRPYVRICSLFLALSLVSAASAQFEIVSDVYLNVSEDARKRLDLVDSYANDGQWVEAVELLQSLIERYPDKVVPTKTNTEHFLSVRTVCHQRIASLPPEALQLYRQRVDAPAADLWNRAQQAFGDERRQLIKRIVEEFYCSSVGDKALEQMGDDAMSQGDYVHAVHCWSQLLQPIPDALETIAGAPLFRFPDPKTDAARLSAKCAVAELFRGNIKTAERMNEHLRREAPEGKGRLAGSEGRYWEIIQSLIADAKTLRPAPPRPEYHTFAGDFTRSHVAPNPVDVGLVQWQWELEKAEPRPTAARRAALIGSKEDALPYFPVVVGTHVHLVTGQYLWKFDLQTGKADSWYNFEDDGLASSSRDNLSPHSLTVDGDRMFLRAGSPPQLMPMGNFHRRRIGAASKLYCFDHENQRQLWVTDSGDLGDRSFTFEGAPVVRGDNIYIALTRTDATIETNLACLDRDTGQLRWRTYICSTHDVLRETPGNHNLLTLCGNMVYYGTNLGAVAAVDALNGRLQWVARYRRRESFGRNMRTAAAPTPCVYHDGRLFVAAYDTEKVQCFDAQTGAKLWDALPRIDHLLGVAKGRLIATGDKVWGIDVVTGKASWSWPENDAKGHGRGVLAGDYVYWPTINQIHVLDQQTGRVARPPIALYDRLHTMGGNLILGDGYLLIAETRRLVALFPYSRLIEKLRQQLVQHPDSPELHMNLAQAAFNNEDYSLASKHFELGAEHAGVSHVLDGKPLVELARQRRFESLMRIAQKLASKKDWESAAKHYQLAVAAGPDSADQASAMFAQAGMWLTAEKPKEAVAVLQSILADPEMATAFVPGDGGQKLPAAKWAEKQIDQLLQSAGDEVYAPVEQELARLFASTTEPAELGSLADRFPNSKRRLEILLAAGKGFNEKRRFHEARLTFKRVLFDPDVSEEAVFASLVGLQKSYEATSLVEPEIAVLDRLEDEFPQRPFESFANVREWARSRKARLAAIQADRAPGDFVVLEKRWRRSADDGRFQSPHGEPPSKLFQGLLRVDGASIAFCALEDGRDLWQAELAASPLWSAFSPAGLLVGTRDAVNCFGYESGNLQWTCKLTSQSSDDWQSEESETNAESDKAEAAFAIVGDTVVCLLKHRLLAVDADRGQPIWECELPADPVYPLLAAGASICARGPDALYVVHLHSGGKKFELPLYDSHQANVLLADQRLVATPRRDRIVCHDLDTGEQVWTRDVRPPTHCWPSLYPTADGILAVLDGCQLVQLNWADGVRKWSRSLRPRPTVWRRDQAMVHRSHFIYVNTGWLDCRDVSDGELRWRRPLPDPESNPTPLPLGDLALVSGKKADDVYVLAVRSNNGEPSQLLRFRELQGDALLELTAANGLLTANNGTWVLDWQAGSNPPKMGVTND